MYLDEFSEIGKYGLDLHSSYVAQGESPTVHQFRLTSELSYGVNPNWDVAAYFLTATDSGQQPRTDGIKARASWRKGEPSEKPLIYWAINFEIGQASKQISPNESTVEIKFIGFLENRPMGNWY